MIFPPSYFPGDLVYFKIDGVMWAGAIKLCAYKGLQWIYYIDGYNDGLNHNQINHLGRNDPLTPIER